MGPLNDGYVSGSKWFRRAYQKRPHDMKRRILQVIDTADRKLLYEYEQRWLDMMKEEELCKRYYNSKKAAVGQDSESARRIAKKVMAEGRSGLQTPHARKAAAEMTSRRIKEELEDGTHAFQRGFQRENALKRVVEGTNPFSGAGMNKDMYAKGEHPAQKVRRCEWCDYSGRGPNFFQYHGDRCKYRTDTI